MLFLSMGAIKLTMMTHVAGMRLVQFIRSAVCPAGRECLVQSLLEKDTMSHGMNGAGDARLGLLSVLHATHTYTHTHTHTHKKPLQCRNRKRQPQNSIWKLALTTTNYAAILASLQLVAPLSPSIMGAKCGRGSCGQLKL